MFQVSMDNFVSVELKLCHFEIADFSNKILFFWTFEQGRNERKKIKIQNFQFLCFQYWELVDFEGNLRVKIIKIRV